MDENVCKNCGEELGLLSLADIVVKMDNLKFCSDVCAEEFLDTAPNTKAEE